MKIAMLSDSVLTTTGYGNVTLELLKRLQKKGHECFNLAHNYHGQVLKEAVFEDGSKVEFQIIGAGNAPYFQDRLADVINKYKFDVLIILLDTFMVKGNPYKKSWFEAFDFTPCKTIFYFPSDGRKFPLNCDHILRKVDLPIAMAKYGQRQVLEEYNIKAKYIPHGVNLKNYYPVDKIEAKQRMKIGDKFVIGVVARNQGRKMLDRTIKAFNIFAKDKDDVVLMFHCDPHDGAQVFDLLALIKEYKLENKVVFTGTKSFNGFTLEQMRDVYNCMDCFFLSTSGEGFGIPTIEAMACKVPVILTDYTTSYELTNKGNCGLLVPITTELTGSWNVERGCMDENKAVIALEALYKDKEYREELGQDGFEYVIKTYDWDLLENDWEKTLLELIE